MILVFGKTGQVGRELSFFPNVFSLGRKDVSLLYPEDCANAIKRISPKAVINAAAYTNVDLAENDEIQATIINAKAPEYMARECLKLSIPFLQISSDYVFDGYGKRPQKPNDDVNPISAYGRSKLAGEILVINTGVQGLLLRTSWIFSPYGKNFVKTMIDLGRKSEEVRVVCDQIGGPTSAKSVAQICVNLVLNMINSKNLHGVYHFSGRDDVSWANFAREIFLQAKMNVKVIDIKSSEFKTKALRPTNSRLDCSSLEKELGYIRPEWKLDLSEVLSFLKVTA